MPDIPTGPASLIISRAYMQSASHYSEGSIRVQEQLCYGNERRFWIYIFGKCDDDERYMDNHAEATFGIEELRMLRDRIDEVLDEASE